MAATLPKRKNIVKVNLFPPTHPFSHDKLTTYNISNFQQFYLKNMSQPTTIKNDLFRFVTVKNIIDIPEDTTALPRVVTAPQGAIDDLPDSGNATKVALELYLPIPLASAKAVRSINSDLYDFAQTLYRKRKKNATFSLENVKVSPLSVEDETLLWKQVFYSTITDQQTAVCDACTLLLLGDFVIKNATKEISEDDLKALSHAKVIIPNEVVGLRREMLYLRCQTKDMIGVTKLGFADYMRVEQELCCYVPGEVSHIENIMASEYKERSTRNLTRSETISEFSSETEIENISDTTSTTRHELQNEIASVLEEQENFNANVTGSVSYTVPGGPSYSAGAYVGVDTGSSSSFSETTAETFAEETVKRSVERVVRKISEKRTTKMLREFEENQKHGYDNTGGSSHITGVYRWIDKVYTNRLINYGTRLILEFSVPEPAKWYREAMLWKPKAEEGTEPTMPTKPMTLTEKGIANAGSILRNNYEDWAAYYSTTIPAPKAENMIITETFSGDMQHIQLKTLTKPISAQAEYNLSSCNGSYSYWANNYGIVPDYFKCEVGGSLMFEASGAIGWGTTTDQNKYGNLNNVSFSPIITAGFEILAKGTNVSAFGLTVICNYTLKPAVFADWQTQAYNKLQQGYDALLTAYNSALAAQQAETATQASEVEKSQANPAFNRITEQRELKRACIEMLGSPWCKKTGENMFEQKHCEGCEDCPECKDCDDIEFAYIKQDKALLDYSEQVRFFEQAFEWHIMSYAFHPYYWADKCSWAELMQLQNDDTIFQGFLQSGMARVTLTVRPEYTEAVLYYLQTGDIKNTDGNKLAEMYQNLFDTLIKTSNGNPRPLATWQTRVPSTLTMIQDGTAGLTANGLPCCDDPKNPNPMGYLYGNPNNTLLVSAEEGNGGSTPGIPPLTPETVEDTTPISANPQNK